jgi:mRNA interferase RelE/StbE
MLPRAARELSSLPSSDYENIKQAMYALRENPRPVKCLKLTGREGWRIRVRNYRVIYKIDDAEKLVTILHVGHRRDIYR